MSGSSARSVRQSAPNLPPARVARFDLFGLTSAEIGRPFDLCRMLNHGYLPRHYLADAPARPLRAYVESYLKEEALLSGLTRSLRAFSDFLTAVALTDAELVNYATIARECGVSAPTAREYFQILVDTRLGRFLPAFTKRPKRRVIGAPKFFLADVGHGQHAGAARGARARLRALRQGVRELDLPRADRGLALPRALHGARRTGAWRAGSRSTSSSATCAARSRPRPLSRVTSDHLKGLRQLAVDQPGVRRRVVASLEPSPRATEDGIEILPWRVFLDRLWSGEFWGE